MKKDKYYQPPLRKPKLVPVIKKSITECATIVKTTPIDYNEENIYMPQARSLPKNYVPTVSLKELIHTKQIDYYPKININVSASGNGYEVTKEIYGDIQPAIIEVSQSNQKEFLINNGYLYHWSNKKSQYIKIANFIVEPIGTLIKQNLDNVQEKFLKIEVIIRNKNPEVELIEWEKNKQIFKIIKQRYPAASTYHERCDAIFEKFFAEKYASKEEDLEVEYLFNFSGWVEIGKQFKYLHDGYEDCKSKKILPDIRGLELSTVFYNGMKALALSEEKSKILPIFLFAHLGFLFYPFEKAGFKPSSILYIFGKTNCRKSHLVKSLFNIFVKDIANDQIVNFTATPAAMELLISACNDDCIPIDDLSLSIGSNAKDTITKFEFLIRLIGDGVAKHRATKDLNKTIKFPFRSVVVTNGEDLPHLSSSSLLRLLMIPIDEKTIDNDSLRILQENPQYMQNYFSAFIHFIEANFMKIVAYIKEEFPKIREKLSKEFKYPRTTASAVTLLLLVKIVEEFSLYCNASCGLLSSIAPDMIVQAVKRSEAHTNSIEPYKKYLSILFELLSNGEASLAKSFLEYKQNIRHYVGYETDEHYFLKHTEAFNLVCIYENKNRTEFATSKEKLHKELSEHKFLEVYDGNSRNGYLKKITIDGKRTSMLCLVKERVREFFDKNE